MPPSEAITEDAPIVDKTPSSPPSGPPSKPPSGPPSKPPNLPADESKSEVSEEILEENNQQNESIESSSDEDTQQEIVEDEGDDNIASVAKQSDNEETDVEKEEKDSVEAPEEVVDSTSNDLLNPPTINDDLEGEDIVAKEAEIARLSAEVERLRHSMSGAADIIEEMENPPMPPMIQEDVDIVADMARMARQLDRDQLIRASMGTIAMLHPERFDVLISTKHKSLLPRMNEKDICAGKLNSEPPRGAPTDWRVLEVLLASTNIVTGGPAAVIHCHGPYSTAVSCEKDLVLMQPIDEIGKEHIGKVIIVDPDDENPREYLRQVAEALKQGGMRCVVIRGNGAYAVGADLDQAWANAAMLEHSMKIVMLARQANLKI
jgi:ribulose-5-phosphate 4-epimerase/fuculose-1-phosphate aldolase